MTFSSFFIFFFWTSIVERNGRYGETCFFMNFFFFLLDGYLVFGLMIWYDIMGCIFSA